MFSGGRETYDAALTVEQVSIISRSSDETLGAGEAAGQ